MTDEARLPNPLPALAGLPAGSGIVLRHYRAPDRAELARTLAAEAGRRRLTLLVAADWRLAAQFAGAGLHLPEGMLRSGRLAAALNWARRRGRIVTAACHGRQALAIAGRLRVSAAILSPVFPTRSHPGRPCLGPLRFAALARRAKAPVYAMGGIDLRTAPRLANVGAIGLAALGALAKG